LKDTCIIKYMRLANIYPVLAGLIFYNFVKTLLQIFARKSVW
jgi:hypothetical protein